MLPQDPSEKRLAKPAEELTADLFRLFERQPHWVFAQLQRQTDQPLQHLKVCREWVMRWEIRCCCCWALALVTCCSPTFAATADGAHGDCGTEQAGPVQGHVGAQKGLPAVWGHVIVAGCVGGPYFKAVCASKWPILSMRADSGGAPGYRNRHEAHELGATDTK